MANFRLWIHEQVSKLDGERAHRHIAMGVAVLFLALVFGAPALDFARGQTTSLKLTKAEATSEGILHMAASSKGLELLTLKFTATDKEGIVYEFNANGSAGDWFADASLPPSSYTVQATGFDAVGTQFFSSNSLMVILGSSGGAASPAGSSTVAHLNLITFAPEIAGSNFMKLSAIADSPVEFVNFKVSGNMGGVFDVPAENLAGDGIEWNGTIQLPFGDSYGASAVGTDADGNEIISGEMRYVLDAPPQEPATTIDMKDLRVSASGGSNRVVMVALTEGPEPTIVRFIVKSPLGSQTFDGLRSQAGLWKAVRDLDFGATYTVFAEAELASGEIIGSATSREITVEAASQEGSPVPPASGTASGSSGGDLRADIISPRFDDIFSGPVPLGTKTTVNDPQSVTFIVRDTETGSQQEFLGSPGVVAGNWRAFFESPPGAFNVRARVKLANGTLFVSDSMPFKIALPDDGTPAVEPAADKESSSEEEASSGEETPPPSSTTKEVEADTVPAAKDETLTRERQHLEDDRAERIRRENENRAANQGEVFNPPLTEEDSIEERPDFTDLTEVEKQRIAEERLHELRRISRLEMSEPVLAGNIEEQRDFLSRTAFMPREDDKLDKLAEECRKEGISRERCANWLKVRYRAKNCFTSGAITKESCTRFIREAEGREADENDLLGIPTRDELESMREKTRPLYNRSFRADELSSETKSLMAVVPTKGRKMHLLQTSEGAAPEQNPSLGVLTFDSDGDGLSDDSERHLGSDPENGDTDGDGFLDGEEVRNGFDPVGNGRLARRVSGIERAMLENLPIEEPRLSKKIDQNLHVDIAETTETPLEDEGAQTLRLTGRAAPNSLISLFIYTYLPVVVTTTTDADGNWKYDFSSRLAEGAHEAYVSVNDDTGKVIARSEPLSFFVKSAQAVSEEEFLAGDVNIVEPASAHMRYFIGGGIALILLALGLVVAIARRNGPRESLTDIE